MSWCVMTRWLSIMTAIAVLAPQTTASNLTDLRWKHRILWISQPSALMLAKLKHHRSGLIDRDILVVLGIDPAVWKLSGEIRNTFVKDDEPIEVVFIGKDGQTHIKWQQTAFCFDEFFRKIDAMPMRIRELNRR